MVETVIVRPDPETTVVTVSDETTVVASDTQTTVVVTGVTGPPGPAGSSSVSDTAYDATTWNGDTTHAPSKNAVRDKIESLTGSSLAVKEEGTSVVASAAALNFVGSSVTVTDGGSNTAIITITDATLTQEQVEDFVGALLQDTGVIDVTYTDNGAGAGTLTATVTAASITDAMLAGSISLAKLATDPLARANHTGTQSADTLTDGTTNKAFLATERTKLAGVATGATANSSDAALLARANHTGTQLLATISDAGTLAGLSAVASAQITDGTIVNADINAAAAIALSKLATDPLARANHTGTQLLATISDAGTLAGLSAVASAQITDGTIVNADINASAAIALSKLATDPLARANHTGTQTASTVSDFDTQVRTSRLDQMAVPSANVSLNTHKLTNVTDPTSAQDAATKNYVDALRVTARRTTDLSRANTAVLADDTQLVLALLANTNYVIDGLLLVDGSTAGDFQFALTGPSGSTLIYDALAAGAGVGSTTFTPQWIAPQASGGAIISGTPGVGSKIPLLMRGIVNVTTAGNLTVQWAQRVSDIGNSTLFTNSYIEARTIA